MLNKDEMLNYIAQNAEMGCCGIASIKRYARGDELKKALRSQMIEYGRIYNSAHNMLKNSNGGIHRISPVVRKMTRSMARHNMSRDYSDSHIAQMMIKGNVRGVSKITDRIRQYDKGDQRVEGLARKLLETANSNIQQMTGFL